MCVSHGIPSFYKLLRTSIYRFSDRVNKNSRSIIMTCRKVLLSIFTLPFGNGGDQCYINLRYVILFCDILLLVILLNMCIELNIFVFFSVLI